MSLHLDSDLSVKMQMEILIRHSHVYFLGVLDLVRTILLEIGSQLARVDRSQIQSLIPHA